jgi:hypothetical protein
MYPEIVELSAGSKLCGEPAGLLAAARPRLRGVRWIPKLRKNLRIGAPFTAWVHVRYAPSPEFLQSALKLSFFGRHSAHKNSGNFRMQSPKLVDGHSFKIVGCHGRMPQSNGAECRFNGGARAQPLNAPPRIPIAALWFRWLIS